MKIFFPITAALLFISLASFAQKTDGKKLASNEITGRNPHFIDGISINGLAPRNTIEQTPSNTEKTHNKHKRKGDVETPATTTTRPYTHTTPQPTDVEAEEMAITPTITRTSTEDFIASEQSKDPSLYAFIQDWYGTRYVFGGESQAGIDCSSFVQHLYSGVYNVQLTRSSREQFAQSTPVENIEDLKKGDLVFFKIHTSQISHVGVYLGNHKFVHASCSKGVMISDLTENYWSKYYAIGGRISPTETDN